MSRRAIYLYSSLWGVLLCAGCVEFKGKPAAAGCETNARCAPTTPPSVTAVYVPPPSPTPGLRPSIAGSVACTTCDSGVTKPVNTADGDAGVDLGLSLFSVDVAPEAIVADPKRN